MTATTTAALRGTGLSDVVFAFAFETWRDALSREMSWSADRMLERLLVDTLVPNVVVSDPLRSRLSRLRPRNRGERAQRFPRDRTRILLHPERWRRKDSPDWQESARAYRRLDRWLWTQAARHTSAPVLVTCHPVHAAVADTGRWSDIVYYGWDDWLSYPPLASSEELLTWSYRQMAARDVNVVGVTRAIVERIGGARSTVVPNAMCSSDYADLAPPPEWFTAITGPVAFYAGSLERRIDVAALAAAADELPEWTFVLVGHVTEPDLFHDIFRRPNVRYEGRVSRPTVLAMAQAADVALIPHRETAMSVAMSPLKLYEYLGAGTAVVATDLPPVRGVSDRCLLVAPGRSFVPAILRAAGLPPVSSAELESWRRANDWSERYRSWRAACLGEPSVTSR
jgi:glycosyltransferase involved in cell wall biosynthesis